MCIRDSYYGGIKKYQWTAIPLALHGVVCKKDGSKVIINIGEADSDPVFCVNDLLPHLATEQMKRTLNEGIKGEELNILVGSRPFKDCLLYTSYAAPFQLTAYSLFYSVKSCHRQL